MLFQGQQKYVDNTSNSAKSGRAGFAITEIHNT